MLLEDLYTINSIEKQNDNKYLAIIDINKEHVIFEGHFPMNPVMPGVCMMQIIKELAEQITKETLILQSLTNVKFMALVNPAITSKLHFELFISTTESNLIKVKNITFLNETVVLKSNSSYKKN